MLLSSLANLLSNNCCQMPPPETAEVASIKQFMIPPSSVHPTLPHSSGKHNSCLCHPQLHLLPRCFWFDHHFVTVSTNIEQKESSKLFDASTKNKDLIFKTILWTHLLKDPLKSGSVLPNLKAKAHTQNRNSSWMKLQHYWRKIFSW